MEAYLDWLLAAQLALLDAPDAWRGQPPLTRLERFLVWLGTAGAPAGLLGRPAITLR